MHAHKTVAIAAVLAFGATAAAQSSPTVFTTSGPNASSILVTVDAFRASLGALNAPNPGSLGTGRREINWDGAPSQFVTPNAFPGDFFNAPTFPRARGVEFSTPGTQLQVSATLASGIGIEFSNLRPNAQNDFAAFSPERLFTSLGSTTTFVDFFVSGTHVRATSRGFGAIFTDVDVWGSTTIELFDVAGASIGIWPVPQGPAANESFSFLGISFAEAVIARVRIVSGQYPIDGGQAGDIVVMDDFIYGEPVPVAGVHSTSGASASSILATVNAFRAALGSQNPNNPGSLVTGRREVNWDGVPAQSVTPNAFPGDFFNAPTAPRARGVEFSTPGTQLQVSATLASGIGIEFSNLRPNAQNDFAAFSPERLFTSLGSTTTIVDFFVPGCDVPATSRGFGAVFTDVDVLGSTTIKLFDVAGVSLGVWGALPGPTPNESFSFLGIVFDEPVIARVEIVSGQVPIDGSQSGDVVVMDDFIYGEPVARAGTVTPLPGAVGCGLGGTIGVNSPPAIGNQVFAITLTGADPNATDAYLGLDWTLTPPSLLCGAGCSTVIYPYLLIPVALPAGTGAGALPIPIPCDPILAGFSAHAQWGVVSWAPGGCTPNLHLSNAVRITLGN